jgi:hypothetical protein
MGTVSPRKAVQVVTTNDHRQILLVTDPQSVTRRNTVRLRTYTPIARSKVPALSRLPSAPT